MSYSDTFLSSNSGIATLEIPQVEGGTAFIKGILQEDPQIQMGNQWGTLSEFDNLLDPLQELQQAIQTDNISNYVSATGMAWKGTPHIKVNCSFYLISFNSSSNIRAQAKQLAKLCTVTVTGSIGVKIHGGYKLDYFKNNESLTLNNLNDITSQNVKGTVTLSINSYRHTKIPGLLTQSLTIQPSTVCVRSGAPLYYVVTAGFIGYRAPISSDMDVMYGGS